MGEVAGDGNLTFAKAVEHAASVTFACPTGQLTTMLLPPAPASPGPISRLLLFDTAPFRPVVPLTNVAVGPKPSEVSAPEEMLITTKFPLGSTPIPPPPTISFTAEPVKVLISAPEPPLKRYTAPARANPLTVRVGSVTTILPFTRVCTSAPNRLLGSELGSTRG